MDLHRLIKEIGAHYIKAHDHQSYCCKADCGSWEYSYNKEGLHHFSFGGYCFEGYDRWHTISGETVSDLAYKCKKEFDVQLSKPKYEEPF